MNYRQYYWKKTKEQLHICWILFWTGVVKNKGHHSQWKGKPARDVRR